jgi:hypothetical protein
MVGATTVAPIGGRLRICQRRPARPQDEYREGFQSIIDAKIAEEIVGPTVEALPRVVNPMDALKRSLDAVRCQFSQVGARSTGWIRGYRPSSNSAQCCLVARYRGGFAVRRHTIL